MTPPHVDALASVYAAPEGVTFWGWADGTVTWSRGADGDEPGPTIAFAGELAQVLARVAPTGLPSFQAVVLLLGACRDDWLEAGASESFDLVLASVHGALEASSGVNLLHGVDVGRRPLAPTDADLARQLVPLIPAAFEALRKVSELPAALRTGTEAKAALVEVVLEGAPRKVDAAEAAAVAAALDEGVEPATRGSVGHGTVDVRGLARDLRALRDGLADLEPARLRELLELRRRTGLDTVPRPAPVELEEPASVRASRLIDTLLEDPELGGLARLARDLRAAVHVPRHVSEEDELPLGGVSDISNRGPLDRLLTSELAHDDLTFVVRVATGEALYLRREAPPKGPQGGRALLVDAGVRLWGLPRLFATAVALAVTATAGRRTVAAFTARAGALAPLDLATKDGLVAHLEALDAAPHPGAALAAFLEGAPDGDRIVVTHEDALDDPELQRALGAALAGGAPPLLVATVARDGAYALLSVSARGRKVLSRARLDLSALLAPPRRAAAPLSVPVRLPAALSRVPPPLRLPYLFDVDRARHHPVWGVVALTRDGRLLAFPPPLGGSGALQLTDQVPLGPLAWLDVEDSGLVRALVGPRDGTLTLLKADVSQGGAGPVTTTRLHAQSAPLAAVRRGKALLLVLPRHVDVVSLESGRLVEGVPLKCEAWRTGRFFFSDGWVALGAAGLAPTWDVLPGVPPEALAVWDRGSGPWALLPDGRLIAGHDAKTVTQLSPGATYTQVLGVSHDGERLLLRRANAVHPLELLDLSRGTSTPLTGVAAHPRLRGEHLEPALRAALAGQPQVRTRLQGLAVDGRGGLVLVSRRGREHLLEVGADGHLELRLCEPGGLLRAWRPFEPHADLPGASWSLRRAVWPDGSQAYLDGRGLLHLVPASGVEVTLVLVDPRPLAAWTTAGELTGPAYYTGVPGGDVPPAGAARQVLARVERFCEGIR